MKTLLLSALLLCGFSTAHAQGSPRSAKAIAMQTPIVKGVLALDTKNGFRGYKFGMPMNQITGLHKIDYPNTIGNVYERPSEPMGIGPVHLTSIYFVGINGRLATIMLGCNGTSNSGNLLAILQQQYGPGLPYSEEHTNWPGKRVTMDYTLSGESCTVTIISNAAAKEHAGLANDAAIKKGTSDL